MSKLKNDFVNGVFWTLIDRFSVLVVGFIVTVVLARILTPSDYGLIGMLTIFSTLSLLLVESGFGYALIQKKEVTSKDCSSIFYFNMLLGGILYSVLYFVAPLIADFYKAPALTEISRVIFLLVPINALSVVPTSLLVKELKIKRVAAIGLFGALLSGMAGVTMALCGYGIWSLVAQQLVLHTTRSCVAFIACRWYPKFEYSQQAINSMFSYSMNILGAKSLLALFQNIYTVIIGRFFGVADVGYYNQATRIEGIPSGTVQQIIYRMTFPTFSKIQDNTEKLRHTYMKLINVFMFINLPLMVSFGIMGDHIFSILLTDKWLPAVPFFRLLCIASALYPLNNINIIILQAKGLGNKYFSLELIKMAIAVVFIVITVKHSIYLLLVGSISTQIISIFINMKVCGKIIGVTIKEQIRNMFPIFASTTIMGACVYAVSLLEIERFWGLCLQIIVALTSYYIIVRILKMPQIKEIVNIVKDLKK